MAVLETKLLPSGILQVILNRPKQLNALSRELLEELSRVLLDAKMDTSIRAILLTGEGKGFCAGADIKQLAPLTGPEGLAFAHFGQEVFRCLELLGKPSLAAIHGFAFGGGCELAMAATLRVAAEHTLFGQPEIELGVIPGFGGTQRLARLVGKGRALEMCLTGRQISAETAQQWGLVTQVTTLEELLPRAIAMLTQLIRFSPMALQSIMTVIHEGSDLSLEDALELEAAHFGICCATSDKDEGVNAFLEKRMAVFKGQ